MKLPIRILCVFSLLDRGGAETMCMNLYRHMDRDRVQFDFVKHTHGTGAFEEEILSLGGQIYEAPQYKLYNHIAYCLWWRKHLQAHPKHNIIHGHYYTISPIYFRVAKRLGCVTIGHSHSTMPPKLRFRTYIKMAILKNIGKYSDHCFACSCNAGNWLFPHKNFKILKNAIDTRKFCYNTEKRQSVRSAFELEQSFTVGTVGRLNIYKNPDGIIEIFKAVRRQRPDARLLWVGGGGLMRDIKRRLAEDHLTDSVIMTDVRADVIELMQAMDAFILPSLYEGLPVVLIEAQAAGLPCFCSDNITKEVAVTDLCTFLPLEQPDLWAEKILSISSPRRDMTQEVMNAGYDIHATASELEKFYLGLCEHE